MGTPTTPPSTPRTNRSNELSPRRETQGQKTPPEVELETQDTQKPGANIELRQRVAATRAELERLYNVRIQSRNLDDNQRAEYDAAIVRASERLKKEFDEATKHRNERYNELCKAQLDYERGDDFIQLGRITLRAFWHFLARSVPKRSGAAVMLRMVYVFLEFLVLPIVQWFSADKPMGELRPWKEDAS